MSRLFIRRDGAVTVDADGVKRDLDRHDGLDLLRYLRSPTAFEDGLTSAGLMRALEPWGEALSRMAWFDFGAWSAAITSAGPAAARGAAGGTGTPPVEAIVISPVFAGRRPRKGAPSILVRWQTGGRYAFPDPDGMRFCSMSFFHPSEWAHLPLLIEDRLWLSESDHLDRGRRILDAAFSSTGDEPSELTACPSFFEAVVLGFLDDISFWGGPPAAVEADAVPERAAGSG